MGKQAAVSAPKLNPIARLKAFIQDVKSEMLKVAWPSREELKSSTSVVLALLVVFGIVIYVYDLVFRFVVLNLLKIG